MSTKNWYVYCICFPDQTFYIGYRGCTTQVRDDFLVKYQSSSKVVREKIQHNEPMGFVLAVFDSQSEAYNREQDIIHKYINDSLILNKVCFKGRDGFGLLTASAKRKLSQKSQARWNDPEYRNRVIQSHYARWDDPDKNLRERQSERMKTEFWTDERRQEHSDKMKGRLMLDHVREKVSGPKSPEHLAKIKAAIQGIPKTDEHKRNLSAAKKGKKVKLRIIAPVFDHLGNEYENELRFNQQYGTARGFFSNLDTPIRYRSVYEKLGIPYTEDNRKKTKRQLGFCFKEELV